ncbi:NAD(P)-dependent oxidoreductase [Stutzerimonas urumqiensis]|uniref:NAD(P)-dependent oxidoreductase n=1 Tax=Stutzerimonas urumqiensis TaxID=638269 RepID=UPI000EAE8C66|nr:NAD(P)H-binding protein [Stutzerimonas urumqiensis]
MRNLETPVLKYAVYGAHSSLGSGVLCELLARQHEAIVLLDDLNSVSARPGLRQKLGDLYDATSVAESVAGLDGVICLFDSPKLPTAADEYRQDSRHDLYAAVDSLLVGLPRVQVRRLLLVADFPVLEGEPDVQAALQRLASHPLDWTLVSAPPQGKGLDLEDVMTVSSEAIRTVRRLAAAIVDELERPQHRHERIDLHP